MKRNRRSQEQSDCALKKRKGKEEEEEEEGRGKGRDEGREMRRMGDGGGEAAGTNQSGEREVKCRTGLLK
ncbi:hypothetical protein TWF694_009640 [Orbilia ellipsospora]|uniref:Uncharacterized protein n=1 Tax=Orbilia ellipsospora TaxID=2528407 RepID=A0AAV9XCF8_9PEZI